MSKRKGEVIFDLKAARESRAMTQEAVAELLVTTQPSVSRWEIEGSMPAVYQRLWQQHWELAALKGKKRSGKSKAA